MTSLINPPPATNDYTVTMRVGEVYDKVTGVLTPHYHFCPQHAALKARHHINKLSWRMPNPNGQTAYYLEEDFPVVDRFREPRHWLVGSDCWNGITLVTWGIGTARHIAMVGTPLEVWGSGTLEVETICGEGRHTDTRNVVFLPHDPLEAVPDHSDHSRFIGHHHVSPVHRHRLLEQGMGKAHEDAEDNAAEIAKIWAAVKRLEGA